jgi:CBS domain-containing protein
MSSPVWTLSPEMVMNTAGLMLRERGYKGAPVVDNNKLVGMLSRRDFQKIKKKSHLNGPVRAFMSKSVVSIPPEESPGHGARLLIKHNIGRLPVMENGKVIGIFSRSDAVADFYGLCPLGTRISRGCRKKYFDAIKNEK